MIASVKRAVAQTLVGSPLYPPVRHLYRRFSRVRSTCTENEVAFYSQFVRPGDLVFDVGANAGYKTEIFLECGARVVSVEPNPLCIRILEYEFGKDRRVTLVKKAVGAEEGVLPMNIHGVSPTSSLLDDWEPLRVAGVAQRIEVPVTTLDRLMEEFGRPSFIKIDVEGFEVPVLAGLSSPVRYLSFEYGLLGEGMDRFQACAAKLQSLAAIKINSIEDDPSSMTRELRFVLDEARDPSDLDGFPPGGDCFVISDVD